MNKAICTDNQTKSKQVLTAYADFLSTYKKAPQKVWERSFQFLRNVWVELSHINFSGKSQKTKLSNNYVSTFSDIQLHCLVYTLGLEGFHTGHSSSTDGHTWRNVQTYVKQAGVWEYTHPWTVYVLIGCTKFREPCTAWGSEVMWYEKGDMFKVIHAFFPN